MMHSSLKKETVEAVAVRADWLERDLYAVLGVAQDADSKTIARAYRKLARELHPDIHPDDHEATERFKDVTAAYDVLGDETKRAEYDEFRRAVAGAGRSERERWTWTSSEGGGFPGDEEQAWTTFDGSTWTTVDSGNFDDLLSRFMGRAGRARPTTTLRGDDFEAVLDLSFNDAVHGLTTEVTLDRPDGPRTFKVRVPAGVQDSQRIRLPGKGGPGVNGGPPGDLYAVVRVAPHPVFGRSGLDLTMEAHIGWPEAVLGTEIDVPTLAGPSVRVRVPAGTPHGRTLRARGYGVRTDKATGDLLVGIRLTVPEQVTDEQREAVQAVADAFRAA
ncbi:MAG TPA: DnaJ C-terminal domain-containing protein [Acidimicrobiales bacterium]|nr:DnaJ C-terminal domain-containing protein [Acidimicrobiales bacterium]